MGYYETQEKQDDGSTIMYMHDKPDLKDSTVVYKKTIDGFFGVKMEEEHGHQELIRMVMQF